MTDSPHAPLDDRALDTLFRTARTHNGWQGPGVSEKEMRAIYDLAKWGATSANCSPARFVFVVSKEAKEKLKPALIAGNVEKTMAAPATVIVAYDLDFHHKLPLLFPHTDARAWFEGPAMEKRYVPALRNGSLQGAYLMLAARSLGLDCGPMSGFDNAKVDAAFFAGTQWKSNFLVNLGKGDPGSVFPRSPRLPFEEACRIE